MVVWFITRDDSLINWFALAICALAELYSDEVITFFTSSLRTYWVFLTSTYGLILSTMFWVKTSFGWLEVEAAATVLVRAGAAANNKVVDQNSADIALLKRFKIFASFAGSNK